MKSMLTLVFTASVLALPLSATANHGHEGHHDMPGVIHVTASSTVDVVPDTASVSAGVQTDGATAQDAMAKNSQLMRNVYATLLSSGIPEEDISTSYLNLSPRYNYENRRNGEPTLIGYRASNQITITTQDLEQTGPMIDALLQAGINNINNVQFTVSEPDMAQAQARTAAIAKAQMKARTMAQAANVRLGRLLSLREGSTPGPIYPQMAAMGARMESMDAAPPLAPGQREIGATVSMTYAIID